MTKQDLVEVIAQKTGLSKAAAGESLNVTLDEIGKALSKGQEVVLTGFGKFLVSKRKARVGRNPQTGASLKIPATTVPRFKAGKALKDMVK
ncbi:HU family DNA-binding protein [Patescibacteria group bacterium]|nr:HU family DNA-binding protein [Patescibacteria group bacterium]MBU4023362.1 HU family DNA-binding protein [Patescibacteria group bacterium]MBU4078542.1 HU family DNA-binding protein [Patescibacteria group bacterium]